MLDLTEKGMFQRGVDLGCHCFWCTSYLLLWYCPNGEVFCKVALQELRLFEKELVLGTSPQICLHIHNFQGSKLLNQACNEWSAIALARPHTRQYLFRHAMVVRAKLYMRSQSHTSTSAKMLSYSFANNSFATSC